MARVTYFDHERACPTTAFHGIEFEHKVPVTLDDNLHADTLDILEQNRFFKVEDRGKRQADPLISEPAKAREASEMGSHSLSPSGCGTTPRGKSGRLVTGMTGLG